jgi:surfeit locus 1 family protein
MGKNGLVKWTITTILVIIGTFILIRLGFWQLDRLEQRKIFNQNYLEQFSLSRLDLNEFEDKNELVEMEYRKVVVSGFFDFQHEIYLQNQAWDNLPGYRVVTPLVLENNGGIVFIDRGWIGLEDLDQINRINQEYDQLQEINGIIRKSQSGDDFGIRSTIENQNENGFYLFINLEQLQSGLGEDIYPIYVQLDGENSSIKPFSKLPKIEITEGPHFGYAIQWFFFAGILGFGYPFFVKKQLNDLKIRSREK